MQDSGRQNNRKQDFYSAEGKVWKSNLEAAHEGSQTDAKTETAGDGVGINHKRGKWLRTGENNQGSQTNRKSKLQQDTRENYQSLTGNKMDTKTQI